MSHRLRSTYNGEAFVFRSIKRCFLLFCLSTINIVNAFIYGTFRCQTTGVGEANCVSWFKVNKSPHGSRTRTLHARRMVFTSEGKLNAFFQTILALACFPPFSLRVFKSGRCLFGLSLEYDSGKLFWINNAKFIARSFHRLQQFAFKSGSIYAFFLLLFHLSGRLKTRLVMTRGFFPLYHDEKSFGMSVLFRWKAWSSTFEDY